MTLTDPEATEGSHAGRPAPARARVPALAAALSALLAAACMPGIAVVPPAPPPPPPPAQAAVVPPVVTGTWREPDSVKSLHGVLNVVMAVVQDSVHVPLDSDSAMSLQLYKLIAINDTPVTRTPSYPAPTLIVAPGDLVRIRLVNQLGPSSNMVCMSDSAVAAGSDHMPDCFHGPTYSNIHYHGFHVTPDSMGDDVLLNIAPGTSHQYEFRIPPNQAPGTMWYHPHKHGSVALEVLNGMSGAFIVRDTSTGLDSLVKANGIREVLAAVQQVDSMMNLVDNGGAPAPATVNGLGHAEIPVDSGEVVRVRLVNENVSSSAQFSVFFAGDTTNADTMYDIARDGVQYANANYKLGGPDTALFIYPGNRLDMFVKIGTSPGKAFELHARPLVQPRRLLRAGAGNRRREVRLIRFRVRPRTAARLSSGSNTVFPASLPALPSFLANIGPTKDTAVVMFTDTGYANRDNTTPTQFFLGTAQRPFMKFNPYLDYIPVSASGQLLPMILGDSQTWIIRHVGSFANNHPFHIHTNPFQVVQVFAPDPADPYQAYYQFLNQAAAGGNPVWSDVVPLPRSVIDTVAGKVDTTAGYVVIRQRYVDFGSCKDCGNPYGQLVMHCHILGHEERGMMQLLEIFPNIYAARDYLLQNPAAFIGEGANPLLPLGGSGPRVRLRQPPGRTPRPARRPPPPAHSH